MITRPAPPSGRPPAYAVAGRAFGRTNLRPVVIGFAIAALIWSLIWAVGAFEDIGNDNGGNDMKSLIIFDIIIGSLYSAIAAVMIFGLVAAITRRTSLARLFVGCSLAVIAFVGAAELVRTLGHFMHRNAIIGQCQQASVSPNWDYSSFWGGSVGDLLNPDDARNRCTSLYNRASVSTIAWLLLSMLFALFFASIAFSFYRQLLDPNTFRAPRAPSDQVRDTLRHQQEPYGGGYMPYAGFDNATSYPPPPGPPPPGMGGYNAPPYEDRRLPGYGVDFAAKDTGDDKDADLKGGDPFMDAQHIGVEREGQSETDLTHRA